jgi:hypothetical protein
VADFVPAMAAEAAAILRRLADGLGPASGPQP